MKKNFVVKEISIKAQGDSLALVRNLLEIFLKEEQNKKYQYIVEKLKDGRRIYIVRPTRRMNFDFEIWVERKDSSKDLRPSHDDIIRDLNVKKKEDPDKFKILMDMIKRVFRCFDPEDLLKEHDLLFESGESVEYILKILKWMFLLEDIYYWNYSRRAKLYNRIKKEIYQSTII